MSPDSRPPAAAQGGSLTARIGFDNDKYLREQTAAILERVGQFEGKLYLEFGGKILYDMHASRVLPGFDPNVKMRLLQQLKDQADILLCIYAGDIERKKIRADFGITYDVDALKLIDDLAERELSVTGVVITRFESQPAARIFKNKLERRGLRVYTHGFTKGYPTDVDTIVSDAGYGANEPIETRKPLVVVTGPGPGSGKLATCLSQLYHDWRRGVKAGYAKFETFPIWNIPLKHPVNAAYEAATADLRDFNLVDPFHLEAHGEVAINYNRDVEVFPVLRRILEKITGGEAMYKSPTDMGVNRAGFGIIDDEAVREAARQELIRRYFRYQCEYAMGLCDKETVERAELIMREMKTKPEDRRVVEPARRAAREAQADQAAGKGHKGVFVGAALELPDGTIVTGKNSPLMHAGSSLVLNAIKRLAGIPDSLPLLSASVLDAVARLKENILGAKNANLDVEEVLIGLSVTATANPTAQLALAKLKDLRGADVHMTHIPTPGDESGLRRLGLYLTSDPDFAGKNLYLA
ncbi:MAG: DUF1846 domain-containing protein [Acidobacteriota bacterium]|nr:DUF1846 domain-containing protein [Acidobacteriota bacterium]